MSAASVANRLARTLAEARSLEADLLSEFHALGPLEQSSLCGRELRRALALAIRSVVDLSHAHARALELAQSAEVRHG